MSISIDSHPVASPSQQKTFSRLAGTDFRAATGQVLCTLREEIGAAQLRAAWERAASRHVALHLTLGSENSAPGDDSPPRTDLPWTELDWSDRSATDQASALESLALAEVERDFAANSSLQRVTLVRLGPADHRLLWTFHLATVDRTCCPFLLHEIFSDYAAAQNGGNFTAPERTCYGEFLDWRGSLNPESSADFWRGQLQGVSAPTPLPMETAVGSRPLSGGAVRFGCVTLPVPAATVAALRALADTNHFSLGTLIRGAWALLLSRYSGQRNVVFGVMRPGRDDGPAGVESMIGACTCTVPFRVTVEPDQALLPWLREICARWRAIDPHERTPLHVIRELAGFPAAAPLFDSVVICESQRLDDQLRQLDGTWEQREVEWCETTGHPLTLTAVGRDEIELQLWHDPRRYTAAEARQILAGLEELLAAMPRDPRRRMGALELPLEDGRRQLPGGSQPARRVFPPEQTLVTMFEAQVARTPERIAVTGVDRQLTYRELNQRADELAHRLQGRGVAPEVKVGLFVDRSPELVIAILAILKAGGAYVPIDPTYPPERISFLVADAGLGVIVTQGGLESRLPPHQARLVRVGETGPALIDGGSPRAAAQPESLAYIIYTSGSTGKPKGVEITHHNVVRLFQGAAEWFDFGPEDVWTLFHSCAFDFSVWEIWGALLYGGRLVIVPYGVSRSPDDFLRLLARERVTVLNQTPSAFRQLQHAEADAAPAEGLALRYVVFGGEALDLRSLRPWFERHGDEKPRLVNMYGITETTVHVTVRPLSRADADSGSLIGVPLPDLQLFLLDSERRPVPTGVPGELYVGGAGLARGYLNRLELTAERFISSPFAPGERLYKTGDLARRLPNDELEYLGRSDQQVKIRGFRIELGEIESVLAEFPGLRAAIVQARTERTGDKRLVAYVVPDPHQRPTVAQLREHMAQRLPEYMVPSAFLLLDRLPLTAHGKVDRDALPEPAAARPELASAYIAPRTTAERTIAREWSAVLRLERVGLDDNFYELGGSSLELVALVSRLQAAGWPQLSVTDFFQYPTVGSLARFLATTPAPRPADAPTRWSSVDAPQGGVALSTPS